MASNENGIDLQAVSRVSRNIDLRDIRVIQVAASCSPAPEGSLEPQITYDCEGSIISPDQLNVVCEYTLNVNTAGVPAATARVMYLMVYDIGGDTPAGQDVEQFAKVNGVYHSWPFLRQFLFDLTSKMGMPPLTLPVFRVLPRTQTEKDKELPAPKKSKSRRQKTLTGK